MLIGTFFLAEEHRDSKLDTKMESRMFQALSEALAKGPSILCLGQETMRFATGFDPLLPALREQLKLPSAANSYRELVAGSGSVPIPDFERLAAECVKIGPPEWLTHVADFSWSAVYASAIDSCWPLAFRKPWRVVQPHFRPPPGQTLRSKQRLACNYLFGGLSALDSAGRPPFTRLDFRTATQQANAVVNALDEVITPIGCLIIEAYDPEQDWLEFDALLGLINKLSVNQAFLFSAKQSIANNPDVQQLAVSGKLQLCTEPLSQSLNSLHEIGKVVLGPPEGDTGAGRILRIDGRQVSLATEKWINISRVGRPLDLAIFEEPRPVSPEKKYQEFREFLMNSSAAPVWSGYANGFAFKRDCFATEDFDASAKSTLWAIVIESLTRRYLTGKSIILHGGAGSGKTVMLSLLAYEMAKRGQFPVFFIPQHVRVVNRELLEQFCQWAEDNKALATLVLWDGMREPSEYQDLISYLEGVRGRRVVLVGSAYRKQKENLRNTIPFAIESQLTRSEKKRFCKYLSDIKPGGHLPHVLENIIDRDNGYFLLALYRLLPETASNLASAVEQEGRYWAGIESALSTKLAANVNAQSGLNTLELAFERALNAAPRESAQQIRTDGIQVQKAALSSELVRLVMVPSRYRLSVPIELIARVLGRDSWHGIREATAFSDLIEVVEDAESSLYLEARNPEEARIYCKAAVGSTEVEVEVLKKLVVNSRIGSEMFAQPELDFITQLLSLVHDDANRIKFAPFYAEFADALKGLRETGRTSARLVLQEATLRRKSLQAGLQPQERLSLLNQAVAVLTEALGQREAQQNSVLQSQLLSELACCHGFRLSSLVGLNQKAQAKDAFRSAQGFAENAKRRDPFNIRAVDIIAWTCRDAAKSEILTDDEAAEAVAIGVGAISSARPTSSESENQMLGRLLELAQLIGDFELASTAFEQLEQKGSAVGYYLRVIEQLPPELLRQVVLGNDDEPSAASKEACRIQFEYLHKHQASVLKDFRAAYLMIRLWWIARTGRAFLRHEHLRVAFTREDWTLVLQWCTAISRTEDGFSITPVRFVQGVAHFHLGHAQALEEVFNSIRDTNDPGRIRRRMIGSNADGSPIVIGDGVVSRASYAPGPAKSRGDKSYVRFNWQGSTFEVPFRPQDFFRSDIRVGDVLDSFVIAFNFIGPFAYPSDYRTEI
jgi:hypothetical protein